MPTEAPKGVVRVKVSDSVGNPQWLTMNVTPAGGPTGPTGPSSEEVHVGPNDPVSIKPSAELWFDTDDPRIIGPADIPAGGLTGNPLVKVSDVDGDIGWGSGNVVIGDNAGYITAGGGGIFKKSGAGIVIRESSGGQQPRIENNDGSSGRDIIDAAGGTFLTGAKLQYANEVGAKINLYSTNFGIGIDSGTTVIFSDSRVGFKQDAYNGTEWAYIDATCGGGRVLTEATALTEAESNARYVQQGAASLIGRTRDGFVMTAGSWYRLSTSIRGGGCQFCIAAGKDDIASHVVAGVGTYWVNNATNIGYAAVGVHGNQYENGKIFDYVEVNSGASYGLSVRCVKSGTYNLGWWAIDGNGVMNADSMDGISRGTDYGGCGI